MRLIIWLLIGAVLTPCGALVGYAATYCGLFAIYRFIGPFSMDLWWGINLVALVLSGLATIYWWTGQWEKYAVRHK